MPTEAEEDAFQELLSLEDQFYQDGYEQGVAEGIKTGKVEGRLLGLEKGFEKFVASGQLEGKAVIWASRLPQSAFADHPPSNTSKGPPQCRLPPLPSNCTRLQRYITTLHSLVEPGALTMENTDDAVNDFDDRVKRAQSRAKIIEKLLEPSKVPAAAAERKNVSPGNDHAPIGT